MNPYFRLKALTDYPEWHHKPLRLSRAEIQNPWLVFEEFFDMFHLTNIRDDLKLWLDDTANSGTEDMIRHAHTCGMVEKLAEAAHLLYEEKVQEENGEDDDEAISEEQEPSSGEAEEDDSGFEEDSGRKSFAKRLLVKADRNNPEKTMVRVFKIEEPDTLKETIQQWCRMALANDRANYEEASQREDVLVFCDEVLKLSEASYCIGKIYSIEKRSGFDLNRPKDLQVDLLRKEQGFSLTYEELLDPLQILHRFCENFPEAYVKAELWDMFDSAVISGKEPGKFSLLLHYQCLLTLTEAARYLHCRKKSASGSGS